MYALLLIYIINDGTLLAILVGVGGHSFFQLCRCLSRLAASHVTLFTRLNSRNHIVVGKQPLQQPFLHSTSSNSKPECWFTLLPYTHNPAARLPTQ